VRVLYAVESSGGAPGRSSDEPRSPPKHGADQCGRFACSIYDRAQEEPLRVATLPDSTVGGEAPNYGALSSLAKKARDAVIGFRGRATAVDFLNGLLEFEPLSPIRAADLTEHATRFRRV